MIDADLRRFLAEGLAMHVATRSARLEPDGARAVAVMPEEDGVHLALYLPDVAVGRVLPNLRSNGQAAAVFVRPTDDRACQVKGIFVDARPAGEAERAFVDAQWTRFLANLEQIGIPRAQFERWITWPATVVRIRAESVFDQTPGPRAGAPLSGTA